MMTSVAASRSTEAHVGSGRHSAASAASPIDVIVNCLWLWAAIAVASIAWWPIYQHVSLVILVAVVTALATGLGVIAAVNRWPSYIVLAASIALFLVIGVPLAVPSEAVAGIVPTGAGLLTLVSGVALGWKQLLTISLPVGAYQGLLVPCLALLLAVVVGAVSLALRSRRGDAAAALPALFLLTGLAFGPRESFVPLQLALGELALLLVWLSWRRSRRRAQALRSLASLGEAPRTFGLRTVVSGALVLVMAGVAAASATTVFAPTPDRSVLRDAVAQPFDPRAYPSPLAGFRAYLKGTMPTTVLFTISGLPAGQRVRIATLDSYDGVVYSVGSAGQSSDSGSFVRVPLRIDQSHTPGAPVHVDVTIGDYSGVWVPTIGNIESVNFTGSDAARLRDQFYVNSTSQTGADIAQLRTGDEYTLDAVSTLQPAAGTLASLTPGSAIVPTLGVVPAETSATIERYTSNVSGPGAKLQAMLAGLRAEGYVSHGITDTEPASRSGHSADRITQLLTDQRMIGDAEQYAVAAAIMARELGFPARVVFGFDPGTATGTVGVTGAMVSAWIEVNTAQYGWVSMDATPPIRPIPDELPQDPTTVSRPPSIVQPPTDEQDQPDTQTPARQTGDNSATPEAWVAVALALARVVGSVLGVLAVLAAPFLLVIAAKLRRRTLRRRAATPLARISGGWREFEDAVVDNGYLPPPAATRSELAAVIGTRQSAQVAVEVDRAIFSPSLPSAADADRMWDEVEQLTSELAVGRSRWQRLRAMVSLRSFSTTASVRARILRRRSPR